MEKIASSKHIESGKQAKEYLLHVTFRNGTNTRNITRSLVRGKGDILATEALSLDRAWNKHDRALISQVQKLC